MAIATFLAISICLVLGSFRYLKYASLDHLPIAMMSSSTKPSVPNRVAMPALKLCEDILP